MKSSFSEIVVDLSQLERHRGLSSRPRPAQESEGYGSKLDRAYVGSCTGGKTSDFVEFARILRGRKVVIDTFGVPATPEIIRDLQSTYWGADTMLGTSWSTPGCK